MPVRVTHRRQECRSRMLHSRDAEIEFTGPDGTAHRCPLIDVSVSGGSFRLARGILGLEVGTMGGGGVIRVGESEIRVNFQIRHVTQTDGEGRQCGVQLFTMSDQDRNEMVALISRLQST